MKNGKNLYTLFSLAVQIFFTDFILHLSPGYQHVLYVNNFSAFLSTIVDNYNQQSVIHLHTNFKTVNKIWIKY